VGAEVRGWIAYLIIVVAIVAVGWNEPLRFRFMSKAAIYEEEAALVPTPPPRIRQPVATWQPIGTALDRAPYRSENGKIVWSENYDRKELGSVTESPTQQYKTRDEGGEKRAPAAAPRR
jgi:hypothetical protein